MPSAGGQLSLTPDDCKAFATFPLAPVGISSYVRTVTRRDRGERATSTRGNGEPDVVIVGMLLVLTLVVLVLLVLRCFFCRCMVSENVDGATCCR